LLSGVVVSGQPDRRSHATGCLADVVFTTATFAALILFAARDLHRVRPRALTALGLAFQPFGVALAPQALDGATYADNLIGSTVTLAGCVLLSTAMVLAANSNLITTTAEVRRSDAWWWGPMVITVAAVLTHSGLNRVPRGNPLVLNALAVCLLTGVGRPDRADGHPVAAGQRRHQTGS
jgi:hypothetical protein